MSKNLFEISPKDKYVVLNRHKLSAADTKVVQLLYQPLIGVPAVSLYFTLMNELTTDQIWSKPNDHYWLLDFLAADIEQLLLARKKLEAIGLLRSWKKQAETVDHYIYELDAPVSAETFFKDEILATFLQQKLGARHFGRLIKIFSDKKVPDDYDEITLAFDEVFATDAFDQKALSKAKEKYEAIAADQQFFTNQENKYKQNFIQQFDFELLFEMLKNNFVKRKSFTSAVIEAVSVLAYLYQISVPDMQKIVLMAADSNGMIDIEKLKSVAREAYLLENKNLPGIISKIQPAQYRTIENPQTDLEHLLYEFENNSPLDFLNSLQISNGTKPSANTLAIVEEIMINQKLNPGVVNVLLHYALQKSDNRISKKFVEEIAATLARKKIKTVREAYNHFTSGIEKVERSGNVRKRKSANKRDIVPSWMEKPRERTEEEQAAAQKDREEALRLFEQMTRGEK